MSEDDSALHEIVVAFPRLIYGIRLMPWGQALNTKDYTFSSYLLFYLDSDGICDVQIPLIFDSLFSQGNKELLSVDQAIDALVDIYTRFLIPVQVENQDAPSTIDYIALEYAPIQKNNEGKEFTIIPVWSFYTNYYDDETRYVISLNAHTGEQIF